METAPSEVSGPQGGPDTMSSPKDHLATNPPPPPPTHFTQRGRSGVLSITEQEEAVLDQNPEPSTFYSLHIHIFRALEVSRRFLN